VVPGRWSFQTSPLLAVGGCGLWCWVGCCKGVVEPVADRSGAESDEQYNEHY